MVPGGDGMAKGGEDGGEDFFTGYAIIRDEFQNPAHMLCRARAGISADIIFVSTRKGSGRGSARFLSQHCWCVIGEIFEVVWGRNQMEPK